MDVLLFLFFIAFYIYYLRTSKAFRRRTETLEKTVAALSAQVQALTQAGMPARPDVAAAPAEASPGTVPIPVPIPVPTAPVAPAATAAPLAPAPLPQTSPVPTSIAEPLPTPPAADPVPERPAPPRPAPAPVPPRETPALVLAAKNWLFGGNLVAKLGLLILFIGVSFLLKYAAERVTVPIELRLAGIVIADIALLAFGWRIRETRRGIGLPVQGGALGILMLVTFAAFRMYDLIPSGLAFGLLFALTFFTCLLAVLQNAIWLAVFGIAGGFLAPIMTSTGHGSHVALFSYYALLNAGILGIALKRSWRALNLLGFAFTFVIATAWGVLRYAPENYLSTQLFLILFAVFYVAIAIAYAARQAPQLKNYVDATLVFGVPLVAFGLQFGLVKDTRFGVAFSALGLGLFYTVTALALWRRGGKNFRLLVESFLSLGLVFGTLALPFALDGRWTSAAWALEGAGVVWVGLRQRQPLTCLFGILVQLGAWISFIGTVSGINSAAEAAHANLWLGFLLLTGTAFLMATNLRGHQDDLPKPLPAWAAGVFLTVAALWLVAGAWTEIIVRAHGSTMVNLLAVSAIGCAFLLGLIASRMQWKLARVLSLIVQIFTGVVLLLLTLVGLADVGRVGNLFDTPFLGAFFIFAGAFFSSWAMQKVAPETYPRTSKAMVIWSGLWWYGPVLTIFGGWLALRYELAFERGNGGNELAMFGILVALSSLGFASAAKRLAWPFLRWLSTACWVALFFGTLMILDHLYDQQAIEAEATVAFAVILLTGEVLMRRWLGNDWNLHAAWLKALHTLRTAGPWLMIWPAGFMIVSRWLYGGAGSDAAAEQALLAQAGWQTSGSWARFIPAWIMMLAIVWLIGRARAGKWPTAPVAAWYRSVLIPLASGWSLLLVALWNLTQNGAMAPLPYLPLLNPLDLSSGFAIMLGVVTYRMCLADADSGSVRLLARLPAVLACTAYAWFNLMLLRSAAHYLGLPYTFDALFGSQFIQAMLSLVWSVSALLLMWRAARKVSRPQWIVGALLLGMVVGKLFLVDLSNVGGVARIISFVGVGLLMVLIGYIAPFPTHHDGAPEARAA